MGAIAEGMIAYAQPLLDQTDGSHEDLQRALSLSQVCFNLALLPADQQDQMIRGMQSQLELDDEQFKTFRRGLIEPMIDRHHQMFPLMHQRHLSAPWHGSSWEDDSWSEENSNRKLPAREPAIVDRYAPCPCNSGKKYKFCCGQKNR